MGKNLRLIVLNNAETLGNKVNDHLVDYDSKLKDYRVPIEETRFSNGEGKIKILESVRDRDLFVLSDVGAYDQSYMLHGRLHYIAPDEHFSDIKRTIAATANHAQRVSLITPLLYESRQDKRKGRESLDCAVALQELADLGIKNLITFDAHNPAVSNAIPTMSFENFYASGPILDKLYDNERIINSESNILVISPDFGAMERAKYYAEMIGCDVGTFYKRRDYSQVINGKNPIVEHSYIGPDLNKKTVIIIDDMIASGGSILDTAKQAKERGAEHVIICATFALFTEGVNKIEEAYRNNVFDYIYSTNLTYVPDYIKKAPWYVDVDCSQMIAKIIYTLNKGKSLEPIHNGKIETYKKLLLKKR